MAENAEAAAANRAFDAVDLDELVGQIAMMACAVVSRTVSCVMPIAVPPLRGAARGFRAPLPLDRDSD
jgi:hypothetical protein